VTALGYARVSTGHQSLDQQSDALVAAGVDAGRIYSDVLSGMTTRDARPGLAGLLEYAREGDTIVVVGIDRLGRNAAEVMTTIRDLGERGIVLRSLREGIDTSNAAGRMVAGVLASLAELELELQRERRLSAAAARRVRGLPSGRPPALSVLQREQVVVLYGAGRPVPEIAASFGVGRDTVYRVLRAAEVVGDDGGQVLSDWSDPDIDAGECKRGER